MKKAFGVIIITLAVISLTVFIFSISKYSILEASSILLSICFVPFIGIACFRKKPIDSTNNIVFADTPRRSLSFLVDSLILIIPLLFIQHYFVKMSPWYFLIFLFLFCIIQQLIILYFLTKYCASLGKMIVRIKVLDTNYKEIKFKHAFLRSSVDIVIVLIVAVSFIFYGSQTFSDLSVYWYFGELVTMTFNNKRRAIHDFIAGTVVIKC